MYSSLKICCFIKIFIKNFGIVDVIAVVFGIASIVNYAVAIVDITFRFGILDVTSVFFFNSNLNYTYTLYYYSLLWLFLFLEVPFSPPF